MFHVGRNPGRTPADFIDPRTDDNAEGEDSADNKQARDISEAAGVTLSPVHGARLVALDYIENATDSVDTPYSVEEAREYFLDAE